jgi:peptidoglycan/xylan/chitin deacetylase (PgdA/CDA1 family)
MPHASETAAESCARHRPVLLKTQRRRLLPCLAAMVLLASGLAGAQAPATPSTAAAPAACKATVYLSFDTGSQSQATLIADTLRRHAIKATFFLANEKTVNGDYSLDPSWAPYWKARVAEGHAFGSHTFDHVYVQRDLPDGRIEVKPQFGARAGQKLIWTQQQYCDELRRVDQRFMELTGRKLDPLWRAPGGRLTPGIKAAGTACGYAHVAWAEAGYSGDELSSERVSNAALLKKMLVGLKDGDIVMAHLGIWSRKDPWAPAVLEPLIDGLEQKGFCFATLRAHPDYRARVRPAQ